MEWIQPKIRGDPIGVRTRHTAVAVHADFEQHERGETDDDTVHATKYTSMINPLVLAIYNRM